jgi:hypothetical protein
MCLVAAWYWADNSTVMQNLRLAETAQVVLNAQSALKTFWKHYQAMPGDIADAGPVSPDCASNRTSCNPHPSGAGDGIVGERTFSRTLRPQVSSTVKAPAAGAADETVLFWAHLSLAGLFDDVTGEGMKDGAPIKWGKTHPSAPIGGGFIVGHADGTPFPQEITPVGAMEMTGTVLVLISTKVLRGEAEMYDEDKQPLTPADALGLDRKMDDGLPSTGLVQAYGSPNCFNLSDGKVVYNEKLDKRVCGLIFKIDPRQVATTTKQRRD